MRTKTSLSILALTLAACGGGPLDPGAGDSAGTGTQTLFVDGTVDAASTLANTSDATSFTTHFDFQLTRGGTPLTTGSVRVTSSAGAVDLTFVADGQGHWTGDQSGYQQVYQVDVTSGADAISGVRVDGPDLHTFTAPAVGATVDATMPLAIAWTRSDQADAADLSTHMLNGVAIADVGAYSLAAGSLKSAKDKTEAETIELARTDRVTPAGALPGSAVAVTVANHVDVVVAVNPNAN